MRRGLEAQRKLIWGGLSGSWYRGRIDHGWRHSAFAPGILLKYSAQAGTTIIPKRASYFRSKNRMELNRMLQTIRARAEYARTFFKDYSEKRFLRLKSPILQNNRCSAAHHRCEEPLPMIVIIHYILFHIE